MNRVVSRGSVLIAAAVIAACAGKREESERDLAVADENATTAQDAAAPPPEYRLEEAIVTAQKTAGNASSQRLRRVAESPALYADAPAPVSAPAMIAPTAPYHQPY